MWEIPFLILDIQKVALIITQYIGKTMDVYGQIVLNIDFSPNVSCSEYRKKKTKGKDDFADSDS